MNRLDKDLPMATRSILCFVILTGLFFSCSISDRSKKISTFFNPDCDSIRYTGRLKHNGDSVGIYWSGSSIKINFKGKSIKALLKDEHGKNYFNVIIDGDSLHYFKTDSVKKYYTLAQGLTEGEHALELIKRTEWDRGESWFYGLQVDEGSLLKLPESNKRVIEFFGNSITAGYAIENYTGGDSPDSIFTNNYNTYAAITARHFKADAYYTVKSGIGIMVSWFPLIMPEMYDRLNPVDSLSHWDFKKVQPHVVVINLLQNDSWIVNLPDHPSFKQRFGKTQPDAKQTTDAYRDFVHKVRTAYPNAYIICALGSMDATKEGSTWPGYVTDAVQQLNDKKILTHFFPYMNKGGHPRKEDNAVMAESLIKFLKTNVVW